MDCPNSSSAGASSTVYLCRLLRYTKGLGAQPLGGLRISDLVFEACSLDFYEKHMTYETRRY